MLGPDPQDQAPFQEPSGLDSRLPLINMSIPCVGALGGIVGWQGAKAVNSALPLGIPCGAATTNVKRAMIVIIIFKTPLRALQCSCMYV